MYYMGSAALRLVNHEMLMRHEESEGGKIHIIFSRVSRTKTAPSDYPVRCCSCRNTIFGHEEEPEEGAFGRKIAED